MAEYDDPVFMFLYVIDMFRYMHEHNGVIVRVISTYNYYYFAPS